METVHDRRHTDEEPTLGTLWHEWAADTRMCDQSHRSLLAAGPPLEGFVQRMATSFHGLGCAE